MDITQVRLSTEHRVVRKRSLILPLNLLFLFLVLGDEVPVLALLFFLVLWRPTVPLFLPVHEVVEKIYRRQFLRRIGESSESWPW